jgi:hypothetical protein
MLFWCCVGESQLSPIIYALSFHPNLEFYPPSIAPSTHPHLLKSMEFFESNEGEEPNSMLKKNPREKQLFTSFPMRFLVTGLKGI